MTKFKRHTILLLAFLIVGSTAFAQKKSKKSKSGNTATPSVKDDQIKILTNEALFINAMQSKMLGNYNEAAFRFSAIIKENPNNHAAHFQMAQIFYSMNQLDKAEFANKTAVDINPYDEWYYVFLGQIKADRGDLSGAADVYRDLIKIKSDDVDLYYDWAMLLEDAKRPEEALQVYELIEKKTGEQEEVFVYKLPLYESTKQYKKALEEVNKLIASDPTQFRYYGYQGDIYAKSGNYEKAIEAYEKILALDSGNILAFYALSEIYNEKGDTAKQNKILTDAIGSKDISAEDKIKLILPAIQEQIKDNDNEANKKLVNNLLDILVKTHPKDQNVLGLVAESYFTFGEKEKAENFLREIAKDSAATKENFIQFLSLLSDLEKYEELHNEAKAGSERFPDDPTFDFFGGFSATINKNYEAAQKAYQSGLKKEFENEALRLQMYIGLGDVSSELKDFEVADGAYEKALEIDPNNATTLNNYAYYLSLRNIELERAERMSKKSNLLEDGNAAFQDTYAWILYQKGAYSEALKWMEKSMTSAKDFVSVDMFDHYGDILYKLERKSEALQYWKKALDLDNNKPEIAEKIEKNK